MKWVVPALLWIVLHSAVGCANAEAALPDGTIRFVVPYTTSTGQDIMARTVGAKLAEELGRPSIVDNRPGASGAIGAEFVAKADPNGSVLMFNASTLVTSAPLIPSLPYDPTRDFTPIAMTGWSKLVLVANARTGFKTLQDLIAAAKAAPKTINFGSPGVGTPNHLVQELIDGKAGIELFHIPYRGTAPMITDLLGGQIQVAQLTLQTVAPLVKSGQLVALAMSGETRSSILPGVPTLAEAGIDGVDGDIWHGLFGPPGMARDLVDRLAAETKKALDDPKTKAVLAASGLVVEFAPPAQFRQRVDRDAKRWADLIHARGIAPAQ